RAHRALLGRVVRYLVRDAGIRQFLDIGTGIPKEDNVHEVAQRQAPESRIVYVDRDPIVLAHAHQLLRGTPEGVTSYIYGDLHDPGAIIRSAAETLDLSRPAAVVIFGVLHFFSDQDDPRGVVGQLAAALAPGSYVALSHLARDVHGDELTETFSRLTAVMAESRVRAAEVPSWLTGYLAVLASPGPTVAGQIPPATGACLKRRCQTRRP